MENVQKSMSFKDPVSTTALPLEIEANETTHYAPTVGCNCHNNMRIISYDLITRIYELHKSKKFAFNTAITRQFLVFLSSEAMQAVRPRH
jgi:hypothetical protein